MEKEILTIKTTQGDLMYFRDWEKDGHITMKNAKTINHYHELRDKHPDCDKCGVFFAFSIQQYNEGYNKLIKLGHIKKEDKISRGIANGLFGTNEGLDKFYQHYEDMQKRIKNECDPQEVYFYEYNNHESMIAFDGDLEAIRFIINTWGKDIATTIKRYNACYSIDKVAKEN